MTGAPVAIGELMTKEVVTVGEQDLVRLALQTMIDQDIGSVVVLRGGAAVGILTERDVMRHVLKDVASLDEGVGELMSSPVITASPSDHLEDVFRSMMAWEIRRLPVIEGDRLVGIVTEGDLRRGVGQAEAEGRVEPGGSPLTAPASGAGDTQRTFTYVPLPADQTRWQRRVAGVFGLIVLVAAAGAALAEGVYQVGHIVNLTIARFVK